MQPDPAFDARLAFARKVEMGLSAWLQARGGFILPVYDYSGLGDGKAPKLQGVDNSLVTPDLFTARQGQTRWVEVKWKSEATWTHITQRFETGIDRRLWTHYERVEAETGIPVWLLFVHEKEGEVRGQSIAELNKNKRVSVRFNFGRGGIFFAWDSLVVLASYSDILAPMAVAS